MKNKILNLFAWYGVCAILVAYSLISFSIVDAKSLLFLILNLTGSIGIMLQAFHKKDTQPAVLNIVWAIIALIGMLNLL